MLIFTENNESEFQLYSWQRKGAYHEGIRVDALSMALLIMIYAGIMCLILGLHDTFPSMKRQNGAPVVKFAPFFLRCSNARVFTVWCNIVKQASESFFFGFKIYFLGRNNTKKGSHKKLQTIQGGVRLNVIDRILIGYDEKFLTNVFRCC